MNRSLIGGGGGLAMLAVASVLIVSKLLQPDQAAIPSQTGKKVVVKNLGEAVENSRGEAFSYGDECVLSAGDSTPAEETSVTPDEGEILLWHRARVVNRAVRLVDHCPTGTVYSIPLSEYERELEWIHRGAEEDRARRLEEATERGLRRFEEERGGR